MPRIFKTSIIILLFCVALRPICKGQKLWGQQPFVAPGVSLGYTFGAGLNWGFVLDLGLMNVDSKNPLRYGLSFSYYFVYVDEGSYYKTQAHRLRSTNIMLANNNFNAQIGLGRVRNKWGYGGGRNGCIAYGLNTDISFAYNPYTPSLGYKSLNYPLDSWRWFDKPYRSIYTKYNYIVLVK